MKKATFLKGRTLLLVTLVAVLCSISISHVNAQDEATVRILESPITIQEEDIGELFNVSVVIENGDGAVGIEFKLSWNASILSGVSMVLPPDHFLMPDGDDDNLWKIMHEVEPGSAWYAYTFMDLDKGIDLGYLPKTDGGTLAIITLNSTAPGVTYLHFDVIKVGGYVWDPARKYWVSTKIPTTPVDGIVDVVPEFSAFIIPLVFMVATAFAVVVRRKGWLGKRRPPSR